MKNTMEEKKKASLFTIILTVLVILLTGVIIFIVVDTLRLKKDISNSDISKEVIKEISSNVSEGNTSKSEKQKEDTSDKDMTTDEISASDKTPVSSNDSEATESPTLVTLKEHSSDSSNEDFELDDSTEMNYYNAINRDDYRLYKSDDIDKFSFYYPLHMYNKVYKDTSVSDTSYGQNVEIVDFLASEGSELKYVATERMDSESLSDFSSFVYNSESLAIKNTNDIYPLKVDDEKGFFIITGCDPDDSSKLIYDMVCINDDYMYQMYVIFPEFADEDDKSIKSYYTECLYRTCGFTNSSKDVRSYEEFIATNK